MSSIVKNKTVDFLDVRNKPKWELLDLREETEDFEHEFFESVISEFTDISGFNVEIYLMDPKTIDHIYGESQIKGYNGPFKTKLLWDISSNEQTLIDMFGMSGDATIQYAEMPKAVWERDVTEQLDKTMDISYDPEERKPIPGDIVKSLWDNYTYEITHVSTGEKVFLGKKLVWSFVLKPYRYSHESSEAEEILFGELDLDDFPDSNYSRDKITNEDHRKEAELISKEAIKNNEYEGIDSSVYGYFSNSRNKK